MKSPITLRPITHRSSRPPVLPMLLLLLPLAATSLTGCNVLGFLGGSGERRKIDVKAAYTDLENQRVAVMVISDDATGIVHREAMRKLGSMAAARIAGRVPGVTLADPEQLDDFARANPYWTSLPHGDLPERLEVDRVVMIDIHRYRLRSPDARDRWLGHLEARVGVIEAGSRLGRDFAFESEVAVKFPEGAPYGVAEATARHIEHGLLERTSLTVARLFHDHTIENTR